tara:strand:+ start:11455 stop:14385 length:2931 start_codon:yes stop_codon:yes gene_type:complete
MGSDLKTLAKIAIAVTIAYFAPEMYTTAGGVGWSSVAIVTAGVVISAQLTVAPRARNSSLQQRSYSAQTSNRSLMIKQPIMARDMVYGNSKKSGGILFMEVSDNNKYLHLVVQVASHEIQEFSHIYFNDEKLTISSSENDANGIARFNVTSPSSYSTDSIYGQSKKTVRLKLHKGENDQLADADLVHETEKWTTDHRLAGIAYIYARLSYDGDAFPNGLPNISAEIKGKKLLDFRTGSTAFSANPALCLYDYFTDTVIGLGVNTSNIDTTSFTTLANLCDENVNLSAGGTEKRYECHGVVYADISPMEIIDNMLTSFVGSLSYSNGKFIIKGGQYVSPTITLTENDMLGNIDLGTKQSRKDTFNTVKGLFTSDETNWQPTDYPMVTSTTFVEDDGETIYADIDLPFTKSSTMAQRLAKIVLFKNRQQITLNTKVNMKGFTLQVGDTVNVTNTRLGFTNKVFEVADWSFVLGAEDVGITLSLKETSPAVYNWSAEEKEFNLDNTTLPRATDVSPPSITAIDELRAYAETPIAVLIVTCASNQGTTNEFEVEAQNTNDASGQFINLGKSRGNIFELVNAQDGAIYNIRARSVNAFNVYSSYTTIQHTVVGKTAPPSDVTNFSANIINSQAELSWTPVSDLDLSHYVIRHSPNVVDATFQEGQILAEKVSKPASTIVLPAKTGTYMIKAVDVLGISSLNSTKSKIIMNQIDYNFNVVETSTQSPNFTAGTKSDVEVFTRDGVNFLQLLTGELFDDASGNFDSQSGNFDDGGNTANNVEGTYDFPVIDTGNIFTSRVTVNLGFNRFDPTTFFDSFSGNFDAREGLFDGNYNEFDDVNVEMLISTSNDNSTYTDYRNYILGDYKTRYIKLRAKLTTTSGTSAPAIHTLSATVDMPDRVYGQGDIASGTAGGGKAITYSPAFKSVQALGITVGDLDQNQHYVITNKSASGFTITFYQGSGTGSVVNKTFDYQAKGYGYLESS